MRSAISLLTAGTLLLAACDDDEGPGPQSSFSGELTGAYVETLSGEARFGTYRSEGTTGFTFVLGDGGSSRITLQLPGTARPATGIYEIVAPGSPELEGRFTGGVGYVTGGALEQYEVRGGSLEITASDAGEMRGTFTLRAERRSPCCDPEPVQIFIDGTFVAVPIG